MLKTDKEQSTEPSSEAATEETASYILPLSMTSFCGYVHLGFTAYSKVYYPIIVLNTPAARIGVQDTCQL